MFRNALTRRPATPTVADPFGRFFERFFDDFRTPGWPRTWSTELSDNPWVPSVDTRQTDESYIVEVDLPGLSKEDVQVTLENNVLTLSGERNFSKEKESENYDRIERAYGKFSRSFTLPSHVDADKVDASFKDGVLTVVLPKLETAKSRQVKIH